MVRVALRCKEICYGLAEASTWPPILKGDSMKLISLVGIRRAAVLRALCEGIGLIFAITGHIPVHSIT